jgi:starch phosphorylase
MKKILNALNIGFAGESFAEIATYLLSGPGIADPYMCLADFESYRITKEKAIEDYNDKNKWNRMSLMNIASSGYFAADRSINDYAQNIWHIKRMTDK